jgi:hypothetical protein
MFRRFLFVLFSVFVGVAAHIALADDAVKSVASPSSNAIDFDRDIRTLLSDRCFLCHGPDAGSREADLRLDVREEALGVIQPDDPDEGEFMHRIFSQDIDVVMPPPDSNLSLSPSEKDLLARWVRGGAEWKQHWSFAPREKIAPPTVHSVDLVEGAIDQFLLERLESEGLSYAPMASKEKLIRRLTFDLTGLPPTLEEIDAYLNDASPQAYEKLVDRLLESQHYGQRMASDWLDVARYSDTYGYQVDRDRYVWPWRDWVIRAFNSNMPYDRFITEQIAGDLLPNASDDQVLATTFNRLHPQKVEGGSTEEEFRVEYVADRTQTFATAFLGLTMECARCHDHKYDPISQKEYYQLFSFFNNIDEAGLYSYFTDSVPTPTLAMMSEDQKKTLSTLSSKVKEMGEQVPVTELDVNDRRFIDQALSAKGASPIEVVDFSAVGGGNSPATDARGKPAVLLSGDDAVNLKTGNFTRYQPFSIALSIHVADFKDRAVIFHRSRAWTDAASRGYQLLIENGKLSASLIHFWPGNAISVMTKAELPINQWVDLALVYDGSATASGLKIFVDGELAELDITRDHLTKNITGGGGDHLAIGERFRDRGLKGGQVSEFRVYDRQLSELEVRMMHDDLSLPAGIRQAANEGEILESHKRLLQEHWSLNGSTQDAQHRSELKTAREQLARFLDGLTEIMVMREMVEPKPAFVLARGLYSDRLEQVSAEFPSVFVSVDQSYEKTRLGLAQWLTDPEHPLTSRVAVNHFWQLIFGQGLVSTPEDFGLQGAPPTHPELLDWLASDFVSSGWDLRGLIKQMVMSRAYRQESSVSKELLRRDPTNELLARSPAYRLPAEMLRDNVLSASGLMVDKIGGPPAMPYELASSFKPTTPSKGEGLYRRSLYTYWKRTGPAPVMLALDASKRDVCRVKREKTSSPLQALAMLNGPQFVEASRAMSQRLIEQYGADNSAPIARDMFRTLTSRTPSSAEERVITELYQDQLQHFAADINAAVQYLSQGEFGDYRNKSSLASGQPTDWPQNKHDFRIGATPNGTERFKGAIGRAAVYSSLLSKEDVMKLRDTGMENAAPDLFPTLISNQTSGQAMEPIGDSDDGHVVFAGTSDIVLEDAFTLEAWVKPRANGTGRIWDKITPGAGDGLLLDLVGGIRFICGKTVVTVDRQLPIDQWSHLACVVNLSNSDVRIFLDGQQVSGANADVPVVSDKDLAKLAAWSSVANTLINHDECVTKR